MRNFQIITRIFESYFLGKRLQVVSKRPFRQIECKSSQYKVRNR